MRKITKTTQGHQSPLGPLMVVRRVLPSREVPEVNPFVFLDHMGPLVIPAGRHSGAMGTGPHPHRGFITFTYMFAGDMEHRDSLGHQGLVSAGGAQWMLAGSGIIHDEGPSAEFLKQGGLLDGLQLWINLPSAHKDESPHYLPFPAEQVPEFTLPRHQGKVRVLLGSYAQLTSPMPLYSAMQVLHVQLAPSAHLELPVAAHHQVFVYSRQEARLSLYELSGDPLDLHNDLACEQDFVTYLAERIDEPMMAHGPFVMNDMQGIQRAYDDYYHGKYGTLE